MILSAYKLCNCPQIITCNKHKKKGGVRYSLILVTAKTANFCKVVLLGSSTIPYCANCSTKTSQRPMHFLMNNWPSFWFSFSLAPILILSSFFGGWEGIFSVRSNVLGPLFPTSIYREYQQLLFISIQGKSLYINFSIPNLVLSRND